MGFTALNLLRLRAAATFRASLPAMIGPAHRAATRFLAVVLCLATSLAVAQPSKKKSSSRTARTTAAPFATKWEEAIDKGDTNRLKALFTADTKLAAARNADGDTLVHFAVGRRQFEILALLKEKGVSFEATNAAGLTPLQSLVLTGRRAPAEAVSSEPQEPPGYFKLRVLGAHADPFSLAGVGDADALAQELERQPAALRTADPQSRTLLHWACECGQLGTVKLLLPKQPALDAADFEGRTPLHAAALHGYHEITRLLLASNAPPDLPDKAGATPLALAAFGGHDKIVAQLLEKKPVLGFTANNRATPLHRAAEGGFPKVIEQLVNAGAIVNAPDEQRRTPLHVAIAHSRTNAVAELLKHRPPLTLRDAENLTPLELAARTQNEGVIRLLINRNQELPQDKSLLNPLLHFAAGAGDTNLLTRLLDRGAEINSTNRAGRTALLLAAMRSKPEVVSFLLARGANPLARGAKGDTALHLVGGHEATARALLLGGVPVNQTNFAGFTPFHLAAQTNNLAWMDALAAGGADINARAGTNRDTALHLAFARNYYRYEPEPPGVPGWMLFKTRLDQILRTRMQPEERIVRAQAAMPLLGDVPLIGRLFFQRNVNAQPARNAPPRPTNWVDSVYAGVKFFADWAHVDPRRDEWPSPWEPWEEAQWRYLVALGADASVTNATGQTPLHVMLTNQQFQTGWGMPSNAVVAMLARNGANLNVRDRDGNTPLHLAVTNSQQGSAMRTLLAFKADPNVTNALGQTPLHVYLAARTIYSDHNDRLKALFDAGANVNAPDRDGNTPFHLAMLSSFGNWATVLATNKADFSRTNKLGQTPLYLGVVSNAAQPLIPPGAKRGYFVALETGDAESVEVHLKLDPRLAMVTNFAGLTAIGVASSGGHRAIVEKLVALGAKPDAWAASLLGDTDILGKLLKAKPELATNRFAGDTLLHRAATSGSRECVEMLLREKADVNATDARGMTPLGRALTGQHADVAELLRSKGAKENVFDFVAAGDVTRLRTLISADTKLLQATNAARFTPLHEAVRDGKREIVEALLELKADANAVAALTSKYPWPHAGTGVTPLHVAAWSNHIEMAGLLLARGAKSDVFDVSGLAPLHHAAALGETEFAALLLTNGANVNLAAVAPTNTLWFTNAAVPTGNTPLHLAVVFARTNMIEFLLSRGADIQATNCFGITPVTTALYGPQPRGGMRPLQMNPALAAAMRARQEVTNTPSPQVIVGMLRKHGAKNPDLPPPFYPGGTTRVVRARAEDFDASP